ncbi:ras-specific guanine nucleotide-releasing factor 2-like isoform X2 [Labeo rohita]|uniref:Ras-specific guanine nucleotide-releasing factor 2-like isoform X2 n=1 Tax=Labeo rohita TaxID=84645 RepID=A0A498LHR0_LABRO|nr:ras-specific guanine nucleotide-releasing factor 2-like isoform X2 [Labeo rohita]
MQKSVRYNEGHALYLSMVARKEGIKRGYLSKKAAENNRWNEKYFALYQNVLFYFENEQSTRPSGIYLLEGCTCERIPAPKVSTVGKESSDKQQYYFLVIFGHDGQKPLELRTEEDADCNEWVEAIQQASYSDLIIEREVLMQKYIHLVQIMETEKVAANQLRTQLEDQDTEIERLKAEIIVLNKTKERMLPYQSNQEEEDPDIKKIKKVQSFMRGWLCRRKWKIIVQDYICSPHAESMRKRNQIVFNMVEAETEYVLQLSILVNCFLRPLRMAASSKKPPISHDDVSSIFLNRKASLDETALPSLPETLSLVFFLWQGGTLSLIECALIEELDANDEDYNAAGQGFNHLEFKIVVEPADGPSFSVVLLAPSRQEKAAWTSDMSQCIDNIRCNGLMTSVFEDNSKVSVPHMIKSDARLHKDDVDICFSKTLNSCKVPQIRYASVERLLERLTDLRFLSIDFLNTFLHTYRIFTTAAVVMDKLADIYKKPFTSIPVRSLELFFATNQGPWSGEHLNNKSPRLSRKFSSPPPVTIPSRTSSPIHSRKLSLSSPVGCKSGALDLSTATSSAASSPTSPYNPVITSPPPTCTKAPLDLSRGPSSPELSPSTPEEGGELPRIDAFCGKLRRSIRRAVLESVSLDKFIPETPTSSDSGDMSPCRSPSTPRHLRYRTPAGQSPDSSRCAVSPASAFAIATAAAGHSSPQGFTNPEKSYDKEFLIRRAATNRVLNVLRHWVSKHSQDFEMNAELTTAVMALLEEVLRDPDLLPQERKAAANIFSALSQEEQDDSQLKVEDIVQMMSNLVASEIMAHADVSSRAGSIEKWLAVADICRCLNNYNGVLEITSALNRSAIYRLKKTWAKVCKQTKALMDRLQKIVSSEGRFKNLRETLKNCNPPCVPYLGMYLTDLAFIEEGTPNFTEEGLVNFSKMRMISHIIREIRQFQQAPYRIDLQPKVTQFLLDKTLVMDEDTLYELSLKIEPRLPPAN